MDTPLPGVSVVPVRTPTLPPATHTNTWILGADRLTVVDPASPWEDEQARLFSALVARLDEGARIERIVLTHHHLDHVSGAVDLRSRLGALGHDVPIAAHDATAALVPFELQHRIDDRQRLDCGVLSVVAHHTPGHAPGHLVLHDPSSGVVIAGDLVAGVGTIAIDPREGSLAEYLDSLEHVRDLSASALLPAHGPILEEADAILSSYIAHRNGRSQQIHEALHAEGLATPLQLVPRVYPELAEAYRPLGALQILTHLRWLAEQGLATETPEGRWWARGGP